MHIASIYVHGGTKCRVSFHILSQGWGGQLPLTSFILEGEGWCKKSDGPKKSFVFDHFDGIF